MYPSRAYAALAPREALVPYSFERRDLKPNDVLIDIKYCGVCHSDIHTVRNEWGKRTFPIVPGHEIMGVVRAVGAQVTRFKAGDFAGVGCFVDSCRTCTSCLEGVEQYCEKHLSFTYASTEQDGRTVTQGGYSDKIVVDQNYVLSVSKALELKNAAPLLCAGITTYSPLRRWGVTKGQRVAVVGLGGLGHMGIKFASAFGAEVTVLSTSKSKKADALRLGAHNFELTTDSAAMGKLNRHFDFILNTVAAVHDVNAILGLLRRDGSMVVVGAPGEPLPLSTFALIHCRTQLAGSLIGGIKETQEMLDYCAENKIVSDVEVIAAKDINTAYERMIKGDVRFRFVIDAATI